MNKKGGSALPPHAAHSIVSSQWCTQPTANIVHTQDGKLQPSSPTFLHISLFAPHSYPKALPHTYVSPSPHIPQTFLSCPAFTILSSHTSLPSPHPSLTSHLTPHSPDGLLFRLLTLMSRPTRLPSASLSSPLEPLEASLELALLTFFLSSFPLFFFFFFEPSSPPSDSLELLSFEESEVDFPLLSSALE